MGKAQPNTIITVRFATTTLKTSSDKNGNWKVLFPKQKTTLSPKKLEIQNLKTSITLSNILVGDVWLCIGQSNMEWPMQAEMHYKEELTEVNNPKLRFFNTTYAGKNIYGQPFTDSIYARLNMSSFYQGSWETSDSKSVRSMSAVGYYFGKNIIANQHIPIGLIHMAIGGAPLETFIKRETLESHPIFKEKVKGNWLYNESLPKWVRERGVQNTGRRLVIPQDPTGPNHAYKPGFAFASGIEQLTVIPIKGVLLYQGESNALDLERVQEYAALQKLMIEDYRKQWKNPKLPFYWVQLSSIDTLHYKSTLWPMFRDEQRLLLNETRNTGMAVSSDLGSKNDVHPTNKKEVGYRLAQWALAQDYNEKISPSGPLPKKAIYKKGGIWITFRHAEEGLTFSENNNLKGFSIDKGKTPVEAQIKKKNKVFIPMHYKPQFIYYAWEPFTSANLMNSSQLPASTFKIEVN